jgi:hypothetical protein
MNKPLDTQELPPLDHSEDWRWNPPQINWISQREDQLREARSRLSQLEKENQWISVKERFPTCFENVIVHGGMAHYTGDLWITETGASYGRPIQWEVTHWRPLPSPPKEALESVGAASDK